MKNPFKKSPSTALEAGLANLATRRETLEARKAEATAKLDAARSARKNALASDTGADLTPLTRAVRDREDEIETLNGVLADLAEQVADQERQLSEAREADVRAAAAKELEKIAGNFDKAAADMDSAMEALGRAAVAMAAALPETLMVVELDSRPVSDETDGERIVAAIIAEGIAKAFPPAMPTNPWGAPHGVGHIASLVRHFDVGTDKLRTYASDEVPVLSAREAAEKFVTSRLRRRAELIVAGDEPFDLADREPIEPKEMPPPPNPDVQVFATADFCFRRKAGAATEIILRQWAHSIPQDAADAAVKAGVALRTDTPEGAKAFADEKERRASQRHPLFARQGISASDCHDLGIIQKSAPALIKAA